MSHLCAQETDDSSVTFWLPDGAPEGAPLTPSLSSASVKWGICRSASRGPAWEEKQGLALPPHSDAPPSPPGAFALFSWAGTGGNLQIPSLTLVLNTLLCRGRTPPGEPLFPGKPGWFQGHF